MVSSFVNFDVVGGDFNDSSWKFQPLHTMYNVCRYAFGNSNVTWPIPKVTWPIRKVTWDVTTERK